MDWLLRFLLNQISNNSGIVGLYDLFQKSSPTFPPVVLWPVFLQGLRLGRFSGFRNGAMDEAQAVLKATDDEAKRICQEIRRIGGTDRVLELFWRDGPWMMNIVIGRYIHQVI